MLSEAAIITQMQAAFPKYIGDDAAVLPSSGDKSYVITKDLLVEDVHFRRRYFNPQSLAHKALHVSLSDIAAMGAAPEFVLLGIAIPVDQAEYASGFLSAFSTVCKEARVILVGGDTTRSPDKLYISVTAMGTAPTTNIKYRHTAKEGDLICMAGTLGYAHVGLQALEFDTAVAAIFKESVLKPKALVEEGVWLGKHTGVHAMMDISDGLFIDLSKLCTSSDTGAEINLEALPVGGDFAAACAGLGLDPITIALTGGEDYGLLFTVDLGEYEALADQFHETFGYALKCIGQITATTGVRIMENGVAKGLKLHPFSHFGELQ